MNRSQKIVMVAAMGLVVVFAIFLVSGVFRRDSATITGYLPSGTVAYLSFDNADSILGFLREIGFVELLAEDWPDSSGSEIEESLLGMMRNVNSLHASLHGAAERGGAGAALMLHIETSGSGAMDAVPDFLSRRLESRGRMEGVEVHALIQPSRRHASIWPSELLLAAQGNWLLISNDSGSMREVLRVGEKDGVGTLAECPHHRRLFAAAPRSGVSIYTSGPEIIRLFEDSLQGRDRRNFTESSSILGLRDIHAALASFDKDGSGLTWLLKVDRDAPGYSLLEQRRTREILADHVPSDAVIFASYSVSDGPASWGALKEHLGRALVQLGDYRSVRDWRDELREIEDELGFPFAEMTAEINGRIGVFFRGRDMAVVARVHDVEKAGRIVRSWNRDNRIESRRHAEETIYTAGRRYGMAWAFIDDVAVFGDVEAVESALAARQRGAVLAESRSYREVTGRLPNSSVAMAFLDVCRFIEAEGVDRRELPAEMRRWLDGLAIGLTLDADRELVTVRMQSNKSLSDIGLEGSLAQSFVSARAQAHRNACINNLRHIDSAQQQAMIMSNIRASQLTDRMINEYLTHDLVCPASGKPYRLTETPPVCPSADEYPNHALP